MFLFQNKEQAFTLTEIANSMFEISFEDSKDVMESFMKFFNVGEALRSLMIAGKVQSKLIREAGGENVYYAATL